MARFNSVKEFFPTFLFLAFFFYLVNPLLADDIKVFGPKEYNCRSGKTEQYTEEFQCDGLSGKYTLKVFNGGPGLLGKKVKSVTVVVNGSVVIDHSLLNEKTGFTEREIGLKAINRLNLKINGARGSRITVEITGAGATAQEPTPAPTKGVNSHTPFVIVEEIPVSSGTITDTVMSGAGMLGFTVSGPNEGNPSRVTDINNFIDQFGQPETGADPRCVWTFVSVRAFFQNGGMILYFKRLPTVESEALTLSAFNEALASFAGTGEARLMLAPGVADVEMQRSLCVFCENGGRFAVLDVAQGLNASQVLSLQRNRGLRSRSAALYYPWIRIADDTAAGNTITVPCSGFVAGLISKTDRQKGIWKAPAGTDATLSGATSLEYIIESSIMSSLSIVGINCLKPGVSGKIMVWGARTTSSDPEWTYIQVARFSDLVRLSVLDGTRWAVFEPNAEPLWARLRLSIGDYLNGKWREGALQGRTPNEAFFVKADRETMTESDIASGKMVVVIGMAVVRPAEFIIQRVRIDTMK